MSAVERRLVQAPRGGRWCIVTIDSHAVQCTVPTDERTRYYVRGFGQESIDAAAQYASDHGSSWASRQGCLDALDPEYWDEVQS